MPPKGESSDSKPARRATRGSSVLTAGGGAASAALNRQERLGDAILSRELPNNIDAEEGVIASIILDGTGEVINNCLAMKVREEYFYSPVNRRIYAAALDLFSKGKAIDEIVLTDYFSSKNELDLIGGPAAIVRIAGRIETFAHYRHWLEIVREKYFLRSIISVCARTMEGAYTAQGDLDNFIESMEQHVLSISNDRVADTIQKADKQVDGALKIIEQMVVNKGELTGIPTGFHDLDNLTRGLHAKEMIVIAGRPGTGKTSIALNMVESAIFGKRRSPTLIFSLEMGADQLYVRLISSMARVDQQAMRSGRIQKSVMGDIMNAAKELKAAPLWIDDTMDMNILEMRAKARRLAQQLSRDGQKLGLIVLDYIQLLKPIDSRIPREQQVAEMSRGLKAMSKELDVPVIVLAQLNRDSEKDKRDPRASDLRESGSIEQDADLVLFLYRDAYYNKESDEHNIAECIVGKNRHGETDTVKLSWDGQFTRFGNLELFKEEP